MRVRNLLLVILISLATVLSAGAQQLQPVSEEQINSDINLDQAADEQGKSSPSVAHKFYEMAYELANAPDVTESKIDQAIAFCQAAIDLDNDATYVVPLLLDLSCRGASVDRSKSVYRLLVDYVDESSDLELCAKAAEYLLERLNSREERERLLEELLGDLGNRNVIFGSELATVLGILMAEKSNAEAAGFYFAQAYKNNKYNKTAFTRLAELFPDKLGPELYLEHLRLAIREDPTNINAAMDLAMYAERLELYDIASDMYEYSAGLFDYLYSSENLPSSIYIPWAISAYNTKTNLHKCLRIAQMVRQTGRFDLLLEGLAGKAAAKIGDGLQATQIFQEAEKKINMFLEKGPQQPSKEKSAKTAGDMVTAKQAAWFYGLVLPNPEKAMSWANIAYSAEPNSPSTASLLAYALVMNDRTKWAQPLLDNYPPNQISDLVRAEIQIKENKTQQAISTLKSVIAKDPGSIAAEIARDLLGKAGGQYLPPADPGVIKDALERLFGKNFIPKLTTPDQILSVQFNMRGNKFPYGSDFGGVVSIVNNGVEPLILSEEGLFRGGLRIDAKVSGDLQVTIPNLVLMKARTEYMIQPGKSLLIPVELVTGDLRKIIRSHPQASLDIEFTLYLDPVLDQSGNVTNRLAKMPVTRALVTRPGIELSGKYLRNRFTLISTGQTGQKIQTAQLFVGLLAEQYAMSKRTPPYKFMYADWMPTLFRNALIHESGLLLNPSSGEWIVKVHTMAQMTLLPMDHSLVNAVSENLNNSNWPVRFMACYLLAKAQTGDFTKVLEWAAQYDPNPIVRDMAAALAAEKLAGAPARAAILTSPADTLGSE